ncbi:MAG: MFS transporter [Candidatus Bipolaricaulaceae bacterium]
MPPVRRPSALLLAAAHALNDGYGGFLAALLPLLIDRLGISLALAGLLSSVRATASSLAQPVVGEVADRIGPRWLVLAGPAITCTAMATLGILPSFPAVAVALLLAGLGTAAFHPAAAALAGTATQRGHGTAMSVFSAGGTLGAALGPVTAAALVGRFGLGVTPALLAPAWALVALLVWRMPPVARAPRRGRLQLRTHPQMPQLVRLCTVSMLRELIGLSFMSFLSVLWVSRGASVTLGGISITVYAMSGALGGLVGGRLSDQWGRRRVIVGALVGAIPFFYLFLITDGALSMLFLALGGMFMLSSNPVSVIFAQELFPDHRGVVSGMVMGLAWGVGSLLITLVGYLGDLLGLEMALGLVTTLLVPAAWVALSLREQGPPGTGDTPAAPALS